MYKRCKVVMLTTNNKAIKNELFIDQSNNKLEKAIINGCRHNSQHLYITSNEEIKESDWFIKMNYNGGKPTIYQECKLAFMNSEWLNSSDVKDCFKIIATTDTSLKTKLYSHESQDLMKISVYKDKVLPKPSDLFIQKYIEEYNKGNVIIDILVEYEYIKTPAQIFYSNDVPYGYDRIKINPKDNTITIKKVKDSWNRNEVIKLINESYLNGIKDIGLNNHNIWIKQNL
jgi:hypothetical protein